MKVIRHDIDPNGDLLIVLRRPNSLDLVPELPPLRHYGYTIAHLRIFPRLYHVDDHRDSIHNKVEFRVSSYHMIRSSTFFEKMLKGPWKETYAGNREVDSRFQVLSGHMHRIYLDLKNILKIQRKGPTEETAEEAAEEITTTTTTHLRRVFATKWDVDAFAAVLNIIHGRTSEKYLPRIINYFSLSQIAVIVDYYQCEGCLPVITELWQKVVKEPEHVDSSIMKLYISWVFSWETYFSEAAWHSAINSQGLTLVETYDLPVAELLEVMEQRRQDCIEKILTGLDDLAEELLENRAGCNQLCSATLLGILMQKARSVDLHNRPRKDSLTGNSIREMFCHICESEVYTHHRCRCTLSCLLCLVIDEVNKDLRMKLGDFKNMRSRHRWSPSNS